VSRVSGDIANLNFSSLKVFPAKIQVASLNDNWTYVNDNAFARGFLNKVNAPKTPSLQPDSPNLCGRCRVLRIWTEGFHLDIKVSDLREMQTSCLLCGLLYMCLQKSSRSDQEVLRIRKDGSALRLDGHNQRIIRLCAVPGQ